MKLTRKMLYTTLVVIGLIALFLNVSPVRAEVKPGDVLDKNNFAKAQEVLPPNIAQLIKTQGWYLKIAEPKQYPMQETYVAATKKNAGTCKVENNCADYIAGLPFPTIDAKDPMAGIKIAWNYQYHCEPEQRESMPVGFDYVNKNGVLERKITGYDIKMRFMGRTLNPPVPNPEKIIYKEIMQFNDPKDVSGTGFLQLRYQAEGKDDDMYAYVPALRRVRRMSGAQRTDAYMGSDIAIEDFYGFSGKVTEFTWKLIGNKTMPCMRNIGKSMFDYKYGPLWLPGDVNYEMRDNWILESVPLVKGHPYTKRVIYIDDEWYDCSYSEMYDKKGELWKIWLEPWDWRPKNKWFVCPGVVCTDIQIPHGTLVPNQAIDQVDTDTPARYTIDALEKGGH